MSIHKIDIKNITVITSPKPTVLQLLQLLWNCCTILALPIESDNGWILWSWYSNYNINLPHRKQSFACGTNAFLVAKNGAQKIIPLSWIKSSQGNRIWCLRCQNGHINLFPSWWYYLQVAPLSPWWPKLELNILPHHA